MSEGAPTRRRPLARRASGVDSAPRARRRVVRARQRVPLQAVTVHDRTSDPNPHFRLTTDFTHRRPARSDPTASGANRVFGCQVVGQPFSGQLTFSGTRVLRALLAEARQVQVGRQRYEESAP
jgi:hypothetical protein